MKKGLLALALLAALSLAQAFSPSAALRGGFAGNAGAFGLEASWDCLLYQPPVGALRPTLDLMVADSFQATFAMRYMLPLEEVQGLRLGGGIGIGYSGSETGRTGGLFGVFRVDIEFDLPLKDLPAPIFAGVDGGYAIGAPAAEGAFFSLKLGARF